MLWGKNETKNKGTKNLLVSQLVKSYDWIRDLWFNPCLYQKLTGVLIWWDRAIIKSGCYKLKPSLSKKKRKKKRERGTQEMVKAQRRTKFWKLQLMAFAKWMLNLCVDEHRTISKDKLYMGVGVTVRFIKKVKSKKMLSCEVVKESLL